MRADLFFDFSIKKMPSKSKGKRLNYKRGKPNPATRPKGERKMTKAFKEAMIPKVAQATGMTHAQVAKKVKRWEHAQMRK
jgi:hypothetical protein